MLSLLVFVLCVLYAQATSFYLEDAKLPLKDVVNKYGYPLEVHTIITPDGYILGTHRIKHGRKSNTTNKNPILLGHGMGATSESFLALGKISLPYYLADHGYDVWIMNARGNFFSRNHTHLNPDNDRQFWNFRLDEICLIDLPANIDYISNVTKEKALFYVGHSQGTTAFFMLTSAKPEYNKKFKLAISMGPSVFLRFNEVITGLLPYGAPALSLVESFNFLELCTDMIRESIREYCSTPMFETVCLQSFNFLSDAEFPNDKNLLFWILRTIPSGLSIYQLKQYVQFTTSGFRYYDYGIQGNLKHYNAPYPPEYNIQNSKAPSALFYSDRDWITSPESVRLLGESLSNVIMYRVPFANFTHFDFIIHPDDVRLVYRPMVRLMEKYK
ncbi:unnamed protein product [Brassicogethes aeneus]|uniref:Lipase n=1 Tax=Brassicogethes aeneus TaxID=1431903 RepID=A0A9P0B241_BRAAE|nr:unnamed protein product [Brassicogethes aeneus]